MRFTKYSDWADGKKELEYEDDAASAYWGSAWKTPTIEQMKELLDGCDWKWSALCGYEGRSKKNGKTIFFPASGYISGQISQMFQQYGGYWTSTCANTQKNAQILNFDNRSIDCSIANRYEGLTIRAVVR